MLMIKKLRESLGLTQKKFAERLGTSQNTIAQYEMERRTPSNQVILSICREFGVREEWLRYGRGEMHEKKSNDIVAELTIKYDLGKLEQMILIGFMELPKELRDVVIQEIRHLAEEYHHETTLIASAGEKQPEDTLNGLTKEEYIKQATQTAAQEAEKRAELDWEQAKRGKNPGSNTA